MPTFQFQSSPPSTPGATPRHSATLFGQHPSTTPAGPPPSNAKSFTPAGAPSSINFPSSRLGNGTREPTQNKPPPAFNFGNDQRTQVRSTTTKVGLNDIPASGLISNFNQTNDEEEVMEPEYSHGADDQNGFDFDEAYDWNLHDDPTQQIGVADNLKASRRAIDSGPPMFGHSLTQGPGLALEEAAKNLIKRLSEPSLTESDDLILQTEAQVNKMYNESATPAEQEVILAKALKVVPEALSRVWQNCCKEVNHSTDEERGASIGPLEEDPALYKATYIGSLLLLLNHPPARIIETSQAFRASLGSRSIAIATEEAYPKSLIDWLDKNHNPYRLALSKLPKIQPNPTASSNFWDLILSGTLRGQIDHVASLLALADFAFAASASDDGFLTKGYREPQLGAIKLVIGRAATILRSSPALHAGDWNITNDAWAAWRADVEEEISELTRIAEGHDRAIELHSPIEAEHFGMSTRTQSLSVSARKAQSKVPWTVYENLKMLYNILLGSPPDIINLAQDWLEATLALGIWWDGSDAEDPKSSRMSLRHMTQPRMVDIDIVKAYRQRLINAFESVTSEETLQIDPHNPVEVVLALILDGNFQDAFTILRTWSIPITTAIMEVGSEAMWYDSVHTDPPPDLFDESDLMVLSYARPERPITKDSVLIEYAKLLLDRAPLHCGEQKVEGWELAVELAGRIDTKRVAMTTVQEIIKGIAITNEDRANRIISICNEYDLYKEATEIAEKYGDTIPETTGSYGTALVYYARAHNTKKVKDVLDLLIAYCLVQSAAIPPTDKLDGHLSDLLHKPRESLSALAAEDPEAAGILSAQFSGYATIRKFYDIRDGTGSDDSKYASPNDRRKAAAKALLTTIQSSADNIQGGLYDPENPAVIPVDGLLVLLGEVSVFVNQKPRILNLQQLLILLRAVEDLNAAHPRIKAQCAEVFSSALAAAYGAAQPDPRELMKKSISDLTAGSAFSASTGFDEYLTGSGMSGSYVDVAAGRSHPSEINGTPNRAWDWRKGYRKDTTPGRVVKRLRLALAEEVGSAWVEEGI